jgi:NADH:ubiquinone oxidoreductase subunit 6 (subunit J)
MRRRGERHPLLAADSTLSGLLAQWPLWLPVLVGALAIYFLLPRPGGHPWFWGLIAGVVALLLGGAYLVQAGMVWQETLAFYVFSALAIVGGTLLITQQSPARAALSFTLVVLATCGLFLLLAAPFLMAATIIVYAGAIVVTFLFVLMLAQQEGRSDADARSREPLLATLTGFVLLATLLYVIKSGGGSAEFDRLLAESKRKVAEKEDAGQGKADDFSAGKKLLEDLGPNYQDLTDRIERMAIDPPEQQQAEYQAVMDEARRRFTYDRLTVLRPGGAAAGSLSDLSGPPASTPPTEVRRDDKTGVPAAPAENSAYLGKSLFTDYLLPVELGGFLLLVATVGAVAIGQRRDRARVSQDALTNGPTGGSA